jgi:hypothetical protein
MSASVIDVTEIMGESGDVLEDGSVKFIRRFRVKLSEPSNVGQDMALTATHGGTTIPLHGALWPVSVSGRPRPTVKTIQARPLDPNSRLLYVVTVNYDNAAAGGQSEQDKAPWLRKNAYAYDFVDQQFALQEDESSQKKPVVNVNDEPFDPVPTVSKAIRRITITKASQTYNDSVASSLTNTINSSAVSIRGVSYPAKMLRLVRWGGASETWINDSGTENQYYTQTIEIEVGDSVYGHALRVLNQGYMEKIGGKVVRATDASGNPTPEPVLLTSTGVRLPTFGTPHFIEFQAYRTASWSALGTL